MCEPVLFVCVVDDEEPTSDGLAAGEACVENEDCSRGLYCHYYEDENGNEQPACAPLGELADGEACL